MPFIRAVPLLALFAGCVAAPSVPDAPPAPGVRPTEMFGGASCGRGVLTHADGSSPRVFTVRSEGRLTAAGLVLDQTIAFEDGERRQRRWVLRPDGPASYRGTLSEASGTVRARVGGDRLTLAYALDGVPLGRMTQTLTLREDGRVDNQGVARVVGVPVRRLRETIVPLAREGALADDPPRPRSGALSGVVEPASDPRCLAAEPVAGTATDPAPDRGATP